MSRVIKSLFDRLSNHSFDQKTEGNYRAWFVPEKIRLALSPDKKTMYFKEARIKLLSETTMNKRPTKDQALDDFVDHINKNYDKYCQDFPF